MSNVLAGIGRGQMEVLDDRVAARRANFDFYRASLAHLPEIEFLNETKGFFSNRWLSCILTPSYEMRERIRYALLADDIESRPLWKPMHQQPIFEKYPNYSDGTSAELFERGLCLPSGSNLTDVDLERVVTLILKELTK
jgi:dTDP-4-amino-4,6-dideoxygalactose transaminase